MGMLTCGLAACSELEALWGCRGRAGWLPAASWRLYGSVEAVRAGCPQRVGGFMVVLRSWGC